MYRVIIILFLLLIIQLHIVKSKKTFEYFRKICSNKTCDKKFISYTINHLNNRINKLRNRIKRDIIGIGPNEKIYAKGSPEELKQAEKLKNKQGLTEANINKMVNWYENKTTVPTQASLMINRDGSLKTEAQQRKEKKRLDILKKRNEETTRRMRRRLLKNDKKPKSPSEKLADNLINETINNQTSGKSFTELLDEYAGLKSGDIIKEDKELSKRMKKTMKRKFSDDERAHFKSILKLDGLSKEELDGEIRNHLSKPIVEESKKIAKKLPILLRWNKAQLKNNIKLIKQTQTNNAKDKYDMK